MCAIDSTGVFQTFCDMEQRMHDEELYREIVTEFRQRFDTLTHQNPKSSCLELRCKAWTDMIAEEMAKLGM